MPTLIVLLSLLLVSLSAQAEGPVTPEDRLMAQVRAGEARNKDDLIEDSLYRLFKIAPDHPEGLAALARLKLRQNKPQEAQSALEHLEKVAPGSQALSLVRLDIELDQPQKKSQLLQARLLARAGRYDEALKYTMNCSSRACRRLNTSWNTGKRLPTRRRATPEPYRVFNHW